MKSVSCPKHGMPSVRKRLVPEALSATPSTTPPQGIVVDTVAGLAGRRSARNAATPYHRLQHRRATFDEVITLSIEGLNKSAIARLKRIAWNTVDRWLEKAAYVC